MILNNGVSLTWLGHGSFKVTYEDTTILIDPWIMGNPACPEAHKNFEKIDLMLITHGHFDHIGDAVKLAKMHNPSVVCIFETGEWLGRKGVNKIEGMNKGGTLEIGNLKITMTGADHSCGITDDDGSIIYGGEAVGFVITFPNNFRLYHAGDTNVFGDMALIRELYAPDVACLPIGDRFTMGPREVTKAIELLGVKVVIPMHFGTFPLLTGTPSKLRELTASMDVTLIELEPGQTLD